MGKIKQFVVNVIAEMKKVSWPPREELLSSTSVVVVSVVILSAIVGVMDLFFAFFIGLIVK